MAASDLLIQVYQDLADIFERQANASMRDLFFMLAADACARAGRADEAERLRQRLLAINPQHMLQGYPSFRDALRATVVQQYLDERRKMYPIERAQQLLESQYGNAPHAPLAGPIAPLPPDSFAELTMPPMQRPPLPPSMAIPDMPLMSGGPPPAGKTVAPDPDAIDFGEDFSSGLLDTPESRLGMRVWRPEDDEAEPTVQQPSWENSPTLPPGTMSPLARQQPVPRPPVAPPKMPPPPPVAPPKAPPPNPHLEATVVPPSPHLGATLMPTSPHEQPTMRPPAAPPRPPIPVIPLAPPPAPHASTRPTVLPPQNAPTDLPPVTLPPSAMPPRPSAPGVPPRVPMPAVPARPPATRPIPVAPPVPAPVARTPWVEPPANPFYPPAPPPTPEPEASGNPIIPLLMFVLMLALGLAVLFFAVVQPFFPM